MEKIRVGMNEADISTEETPIIGTDAFAKIETWYKADELKKLVHFIVFPRRGDEISGLDDWDYEITNMDYVDISSTQIRNSEIKNTNLNILEYIKENELYQN